MNETSCGEVRNEAAPGGALRLGEEAQTTRDTLYPLTPTPTVGKLSYKINIEEVANGFIARAGCQTFVFNSSRDLMEALEMYFTNPDAATKKYLIGDKK